MVEGLWCSVDMCGQFVGQYAEGARIVIWTVDPAAFPSDSLGIDRHCGSQVLRLIFLQVSWLLAAGEWCGCKSSELWLRHLGTGG